MAKIVHPERQDRNAQAIVRFEKHIGPSLRAAYRDFCENTKRRAPEAGEFVLAHRYGEMENSSCASSAAQIVGGEIEVEDLAELRRGPCIVRGTTFGKIGEFYETELDPPWLTIADVDR